MNPDMPRIWPHKSLLTDMTEADFRLGDLADNDNNAPTPKRMQQMFDRADRSNGGYLHG